MKFPFSPEVRQRIEAARKQCKELSGPMPAELVQELHRISQWVLSPEYQDWHEWKDAHPDEEEE